MKNIKFKGLLLISLLFSHVLFSQEQETTPVTLEKVSGNIYQILGGRGATGGAYIGEKSVLVIDSKMDETSVKQTIAAIAELTDQPIKYLVNTHSDGDHIMGNRYFPATVTFVAHKNCRSDFFKENFGRVSDWGEPEFLPFTPSVTFINNMELWIGSKKVELHYFGVGHTTGDCVVYFPDEKVAFIGDQYFNGRPQLIHSHKNGNSFEHVKTLSKMLATIDAEKFSSGHSDIIGRNDLKNHIQAMVERQQKIQTLMAKNKTQEEVIAEFPEDETRLVTSIFNEINSR